MDRKQISQFRQDLVTGGWVLIATARAKRPHAFQRREPHADDPLETCPFENPQASGNAEPVLRYPHPTNPHDWSVQIIPNKFQYFNMPTPGRCPVPYPVGEVMVMDGDGFGEILIMRDHTRHLPDLTLDERTRVVGALHERFRKLQEEACVKYISIFHNYGREVGGSLTHPHSQILALPVIPPDIAASLAGSQRYFSEHRACVHCVLARSEEHSNQRIIYSNELFLVIEPFATRMPFETTIMPRQHQPHFARIDDAERRYFADALGITLKKLKIGLGDPAYNFYIHTAPVDGEYSHYHWHCDIIPKTAIWAGFELATGIEISTIAPEDAAAFLRDTPV